MSKQGRAIGSCVWCLAPAPHLQWEGRVEFMKFVPFVFLTISWETAMSLGIQGFY